MKNCLIIGTNFYPEPIGIPRYTTQMAEYLNKDCGHEVSVICCYPLYPNWEKRDGYNYKKFEIEHHGKVCVYRVPTYCPKKNSLLQRSIYELFFLYSSLKLLPIIKNYKNVIVTSPPFLLALFSIFLKKQNKILIVKDMQVEIGEALSPFLIKPIFKIIKYIELYLFSKFDHITCVNHIMVDHYKKKLQSKTHISFFPDWVDLSKVKRASKDQISKFKKMNGIADNLIVGYSGNISRKQGLEIFVKIAHSLKDLNISFVIFGEGAGKEELMEYSDAKKLKNIMFFDLVPESQLNIMLSSIDIHIVPQLETFADLVMPGKIFNILACRKTLLTITPKSSFLHNIVTKNNMGFSYGWDEIKSIQQTIIDIYENRVNQDYFRENGLKYIKKNYDKIKVLNMFSSKLLDV